MIIFHALLSVETLGKIFIRKNGSGYCFPELVWQSFRTGFDPASSERTVTMTIHFSLCLHNMFREIPKYKIQTKMLNLSSFTHVVPNPHDFPLFLFFIFFEVFSCCSAPDSKSEWWSVKLPKTTKKCHTSSPYDPCTVLQGFIQKLWVRNTPKCKYKPLEIFPSIAAHEYYWINKFVFKFDTLQSVIRQ